MKYNFNISNLPTFQQTLHQKPIILTYPSLTLVGVSLWVGRNGCQITFILISYEPKFKYRTFGLEQDPNPSNPSSGSGVVQRAIKFYLFFCKINRHTHTPSTQTDGRNLPLAHGCSNLCTVRMEKLWWWPYVWGLWDPAAAATGTVQVVFTFWCVCVCMRVSGGLFCFYCLSMYRK